MGKFNLSFHSDDSFNLDHDNRKYCSKNIDQSKTKNNISYEGNIPIEDFYMQTFQSAYEAYIQKQKDTGHGGRVKDAPPTYYEFVVKKQQEAEKKLQEAKMGLAHKKELKQNHTRVAKQIIVQMGNVDDFSQMDETTQTELSDRMADALTEYMNTFQQENPPFRIVNAVIHRDEMSVAPHLHLTYVPVAEATRGQTVVNSEVAALKAMGFISDEQKRADGEFETCQTKWQTKERDRMISIAARHGIETGYTRGNRGKGQTIDEYRATMDAVRQSQALETEAKALASLSIHNEAGIAEQDRLISQNNMALHEQEQLITENTEHIEQQQANIQNAHEEYERVRQDVAAVTEQLQEAKKLEKAISNFENTLNTTYLTHVPTEHPYELKKNKKTKTKEKVYQVPEKDYVILQQRNGLQPQHMRLLVAEILEPIKRFLERMPIFKKLSQQIAELQTKLIAKDRELERQQRQLESSREDVQKLRNYIKTNLHKSDAQIDKIINPDRPSRPSQQHDLGDDVLGDR